MTRHACVAAIVLLCGLVEIVPAQVPPIQNGSGALPRYGRLDPASLQAIQSVGRTVLSAKHSRQPDPDEAALRSTLEQLGEALEQGTAVAQFGVTTEERAGRPPQNGEGEAARSNAVLQGHLAALRGHRVGLSRRAQQGSNDQHAAVLTEKAAEIENELNTALSETGALRFEKLAVLRERLRFKNLQEHLNDLRRAEGLPEAKPEPTISTAARHQ